MAARVRRVAQGNDDLTISRMNEFAGELKTRATALASARPRRPAIAASLQRPSAVRSARRMRRLIVQGHASKVQ